MVSYLPMLRKPPFFPPAAAGRTAGGRPADGPRNRRRGGRPATAGGKGLPGLARRGKGGGAGLA